MWTETTITTDRLDFPALTAGEGQPLLCLHGFPDLPQTFTPLAERLVEDGWRVVAPYLRGYHPDAMPAQPHYDAVTIAADAAAQCAALSPDAPMAVVGHDFGALAVFGLTAAFPERVSRAVAMAVPPPSGQAAIFSDPAQLQRSFYIWLFQLDHLPEAVLTSDGAFVDHLWRTWSPNLPEPPHQQAVREALADPAIAAAALGYYRSIFSKDYRDPALAELRGKVSQPPAVPTLVLGGADDGCMGPELFAESCAGLPGDCAWELLEAAGHFLHLDAPDAVASRIDDWLKDR